MSVTVSVNGVSLSDALAKLGSSAALSDFNSEALLAELRQRFVSQTPPMVLKVVPFAAEGTEAAPADATPPATTKPRGRPKATKPADADKAPAEATPAQVDPPKTEAPKPTVAEVTDDDFAAEEPTSEATDDGFGETAEETAAKLTQDDVRSALNSHKDKRGLVTSRGIMAKVGGTSKLVEFPEAKYAELIAALSADMR